MAFALRRGTVLLLSLAVLLVATFLTMQLTGGDPVRSALGPSASPELVAERRASLGLDDPLPTQFAHYVSGVARGDLGVSIADQRPVSTMIGERFPATLRLAALAFAVCLLVGVPSGIAVAVATRGGRRRRLASWFSSGTGLAASIPEYVCAAGLVALFGVTLQWLPIAGADGPQSYVLPVIALATVPTASIARIARVETQAVLGEEYVRVARAKRLPDRALYLRHVLPNALTATLTVGGLLFGTLVAGTVIVENVFAWPGLGGEIVRAIIAKDYPVVQAIVLLLGTIVLCANLLVDVALAALDPRTLVGDR